MGNPIKLNETQRELNRLSLRIALLKYDLLEGVLDNKPIPILNPIMIELSILQVRKFTILTGRFEELPNHIKKMYDDY